MLQAVKSRSTAQLCQQALALISFAWIFQPTTHKVSGLVQLALRLAVPACMQVIVKPIHAALSRQNCNRLTACAVQTGTPAQRPFANFE